MFKKLDLYIARKYLGTFFYTILLITMIAVVIDFSEKVDKLLVPELSLWDIIFDYYLHFIPWINGLLWPIFALISVVFFTSRLAKNSEIVSILSSGISYNRLLLPFLMSAGILATLLWFGNNYLIPRSTKLKNDFEQTYIDKNRVKTLGYNTHFFLNPTEKVYLRYFRTKDTTGQTFRLETFDEEGKLTQILKANKLKMKEPPNRWTLEDYERRTIDGLNESIVTGKGETIDTTLALTTDDFVRNSKQIENMTTPALLNYIQVEKSKGLDSAQAIMIEVHRRTADPFTIIILTMMGVALASRKVRGGLGLHLALGVAIGAGFVVVQQFSKTIASSVSANPALGMWVPNIIFGLVAIYLISKAQK